MVEGAAVDTPSVAAPPVRFAPGVQSLLVDIDRVRPSESNPNSGDVDAICESIIVNGYRVPVIARADTGHIVSGNHRYYALLRLGATQIPVLWDEFSSDDAATRFAIAVNRVARLGRDDPAQLAEILDELSGAPIGLAGTGFEQDDLETLHRLIGTPLHFGDDDDALAAEATKYAKQRGSKVLTCPACGHEFGGR